MDIERNEKESILDFATRLLSEDNIYDIGLVEIYRLLFDEEVSYDNAQRQLRGLKKFLNLYEIDNDNNLDTGTIDEIINKKIDISINKDGSQTRNALLELSEEQIKTPKLLLKAHGYDVNKFELVNSKNSMWHQRSNERGLSTLYCSKVTVRPKETIGIEDVQRIFDNLDRKFQGAKENKKCNCTCESNKEKAIENKCFILNYFDIHFSKMALLSETDNEYNYKIAKERMLESTKRYIEKNKNNSFEKVIFCIGQDYFNSEPNGCTINNTKQDNDLNYSDMFENGIEVLINIIDMLYEEFKCEIHIPLVQGNHSGYVEFYAAQVLKAWYRRDDSIIIDASPLPRKYIQYGTNLFGFAHNSDEKKRLDGLMQVEVPKLWGETIERTWFTGHLHNEDVKTGQGVFIRQAPTMCGTDSWHKKLGYVGDIRRTQAFIYDKNDGLTDIQYIKV